MTREHRMIIGCAAVVAILVPVLALVPYRATHIDRAAAIVVAPSPVPPAAQAALARPLFSNSVRAAAATDAVPPLVGIVGRLPADAVALVRDRGRVRTIAIGENAAGWRLIALSAEAAVFERGGERRSVALPAQQ